MLSDYWKNNYAEMITFYPRFYRDVYEMDETVQAEGELLDGVDAGINLVLLNNFIETMDEDTIGLMEKYLGISLIKSRTLEERRRLIRSYFAGMGKVSATRIAELIYSYTGATVTCEFYPFDEEGNNRLDIIFARGDEESLYWSDIYTLLSKMLPAHIEYRAMIDYTVAVVVGASRTKYKYSYPLCGLYPQTTLLADINTVDAATEADVTPVTMTYLAAGETGVSGKYPQSTLLAETSAVDVAIAQDITNVTSTYPSTSEAAVSGKYPQTTALADANSAEAATESVATVASISYSLCGQGYAG